MVDKIHNYLFTEEGEDNNVLVPNKDTKTEVSIEIRSVDDNDTLNSLSFIFLKDEIDKHGLSNKEANNKKTSEANIETIVNDGEIQGTDHSEDSVIGDDSDNESISIKSEDDDQDDDDDDDDDDTTNPLPVDMIQDIKPESDQDDDQSEDQDDDQEDDQDDQDDHQDKDSQTSTQTESSKYIKILGGSHYQGVGLPDNLKVDEAANLDSVSHYSSYNVKRGYLPNMYGGFIRAGSQTTINNCQDNVSSEIQTGGFIRAGSQTTIDNCSDTELTNIDALTRIQNGGFIRAGSSQQFYYCPSPTLSESSLESSVSGSSFSEGETVESSQMSTSQSGGFIRAGSHHSLINCDHTDQFGGENTSSYTSNNTSTRTSSSIDPNDPNSFILDPSDINSLPSIQLTRSS